MMHDTGAKKRGWSPRQNLPKTVMLIWSWPGLRRETRETWSKLAHRAGDSAIIRRTSAAELAVLLGCATSSISRRLAALRRAGLIQTRSANGRLAIKLLDPEKVERPAPRRSSKPLEVVADPQKRLFSDSQSAQESPCCEPQRLSLFAPDSPASGSGTGSAFGTKAERDSAFAKKAEPVPLSAFGPKAEFATYRSARALQEVGVVQEVGVGVGVGEVEDFQVLFSETTIDEAATLRGVEAVRGPIVRLVNASLKAMGRNQHPGPLSPRNTDTLVKAAWVALRHTGGQWMLQAAGRVGAGRPRKPMGAFYATLKESYQRWAGPRSGVPKQLNALLAITRLPAWLTAPADQPASPPPPIAADETHGGREAIAAAMKALKGARVESSLPREAREEA